MKNKKVYKEQAKYIELEKESGNEVIIRNKDTQKEKEIVFIK